MATQALGNKRAWSNRGEMTIGNPTKRVSLQAKFEEDPGSYTIQFDVTRPPGITFRDIRAFISWSVEGQSVERIISVQDGVTITGNGQGVRVVVQDVTNLAYINPGGLTPPIVFIADYDCVVTIVKGVRASNQTEPFILALPETFAGFIAGQTEQAVVINAGQNADFPVPSDAGITSTFVTVTSLTAPLTNSEVIVSHLNPVVGTSKIYSPLINSGWVPLTGEVEIVRISNLSMEAIRASVTFGVDG